MIKSPLIWGVFLFIVTILNSTKHTRSKLEVSIDLSIEVSMEVKLTLEKDKTLDISILIQN